MISLRRLLTGYLLATLLLTLIGVSGGVYWLVSRHLFHANESRLRGQLGLTRHSGALALPLPNAERYATPQLLVRVYDAQGKRLQQAGGPPQDPPEARPDMLETLRRGNRASMLYPSHNHHEGWMFLAVKCLDAQGNYAGAIEIGTGTRPSHDLMRALSGYLVLCTALGLALGTVACGLLARRVGGPVEDLAEAARSVAAGDWQARADEATGPSEVRSLAADFNAMVGQLRESLETQRRFTADASHELKTPLTSVGAMAEILETHDVDPANRNRALVVISREVERMEHLVNDLLTLSRLEHPDQEAAPLELSGEIQGLLDEYRLRRPNLSWKLTPDLRVRIAPQHWQRLLRNLLDNALHYTPAERNVSVVLKPGVVLEVRDEGEGIAEEALPHLFKRFYRADVSRARASGGTGLGLSIVQTIVDNAGGRVEIASRPGEGTVVTVSLPEAL
ncbi:MAG: HAMP domain-containing histidine kinase [Candidatus Eremiobacteraeota bacterium]|nr:HAMP domain-containing histidine kinase [Candidatus Eremiobacteraeota bacterium]